MAVVAVLSLFAIGYATEPGSPGDDEVTVPDEADQEAEDRERDRLGEVGAEARGEGEGWFGDVALSSTARG